LKRKDGVWTILCDEASRQKIAHAIQYQIRTEYSHRSDDPDTSTVHSPPIAKTIVKKRPQYRKVANTDTSALALRKLRSLRPLPTAENNSETQLPKGFLQHDDRSVQLSTAAIGHTNEGSYEQWVLQQSLYADRWSIPVTANRSEIFDSSALFHSKIDNHIDSHLLRPTQVGSAQIGYSNQFEHACDIVSDNTKLSCIESKNPFDPSLTQRPRRTATDPIAFSQLMEYPVDVGSQYIHPSNNHAVVNDHCNDYRHTLESRSSAVLDFWNRKNPPFLDHIDKIQSHLSQQFGILLDNNNNNVPIPPAPVIHSLDVSGVSLWDGSVAFYEKNEDVDVKNDDTSVPPYDSNSCTHHGDANEVRPKQQEEELLACYPNSAWLRSSIEADISQTLPTTRTALNRPFSTLPTMSDTAPGIVVATDPSPLETLLRAASDFSRDDSFF
jgi:hypothetical protein